MITIEELDKLIQAEFKDTVTINEWEKKKNLLNDRYEPEYADADKVIWVKSKGWFNTYIDELAYFCWKCGCNLVTTRDWVDGSETCTVSLPETEEEYHNNLVEADKYWKEVFE